MLRLQLVQQLAIWIQDNSISSPMVIKASLQVAYALQDQTLNKTPATLQRKQSKA